MDAHEKEMYRMELEVNRLNTARGTEQEERVKQVRKDFDSEIELAIQAEKAKNAETIDSALAGLRTNLENEKDQTVRREEERIQGKVLKRKNA